MSHLTLKILKSFALNVVSLSLSFIERLYAFKLSWKLAWDLLNFSLNHHTQTLVKFSSAVQYVFSLHMYYGLVRSSQLLFYYDKYHLRWHVEINFAYGALRSSHVQYQSKFYLSPFLKLKNKKQVNSRSLLEEGLNINARYVFVFQLNLIIL